jgi:hypothetical protein
MTSLFAAVTAMYGVYHKSNREFELEDSGFKVQPCTPCEGHFLVLLSFLFFKCVSRSGLGCSKMNCD